MCEYNSNLSDYFYKDTIIYICSSHLALSYILSLQHHYIYSLLNILIYYLYQNIYDCQHDVLGPTRTLLLLYVFIEVIVSNITKRRFGRVLSRGETSRGNLIYNEILPLYLCLIIQVFN